jgi:hypothetical protein
MDNTTLATTTYSWNILVRLGLARLFVDDIALLGWRRPSGPRLAPHRVTFQPTKRTPTDRVVGILSVGGLFSGRKICKVGYSNKC